MSEPLWNSTIPAPTFEPERFGWLRAVRRGVPLLVLILVCLPLMMGVRFFERMIWGAKRPYSSWFPRFVSRNALRFMGIGLRTHGQPMLQSGAVVANHSSWLDIFAMNACQTIFFVSKAEVANWPGIGLLARATGTVFITRQRKEAAKQKAIFEARLQMGHKLLFFPEGTSTDSLRILPFKPTLFAAFFEPELREKLYIQPVTAHYIAPNGADPRFYGWWGDMDFVPSLMKLLQTKQHGRVEVIFHAPIAVKGMPDRKAMAQKCEAEVRSGLPDIPKAYLNA